jgi:RNA polymerase sigma factor (sigma-70 family)
MDQRHLYAEVVRCVRDLPDHERAAAKLRWWEGMTCRQIARLRRIREKSAEQLVARARRKIRSACLSGE